MALDPRALEEKVRSNPAMRPPQAAANQYTQAKKTLQSASGGFGFFSNKEDKYQNAADLYVQAANAYRLERLSACRQPTVAFPSQADTQQTRKRGRPLRQQRVFTGTS